MVTFSVFFGPEARATQTDLHGPPGSVGFGTSVVVLSNGNFVVTDPNHGIPAGAAQVGAVFLYSHDGTLISTLTGSKAGDKVGEKGITVLTNGSFVINSPSWNGGEGAVTLSNGTTGLNGMVSAANSLTGTATTDHVGIGGVTALTNGNFVVASPEWNHNTGAVTWSSGTASVKGAVAATNSLVGAKPEDSLASDNQYGVTALTNGNYVVCSPNWDGTKGAVTWGNGITGTKGIVSAANSLVGSAIGDQAGEEGVVPLTNGNYVVDSLSWNGVGAVTWGNGTTGIAGAISTSNSLAGSTAGDSAGLGGVTALSNGNYVVNSPFWQDAGPVQKGALTWGNGASGISGTISSANSLIGYTTGGSAGLTYVVALTNGNYVVGCPGWSNYLGVAAWGNGTTGTTGTVSAANALVGSAIGDSVCGDGIVPLSNGSYVVVSSQWGGGKGAATWGSGTAVMATTVSSSSSLVGTYTTDRVGLGGVTDLRNGHYVVNSLLWNDAGNVGKSSLGAVTWADAATGTTGAVSAANSLVGAATGDNVGLGGVVALTNGNYVVSSSLNQLGGTTWVDGSVGITGPISTASSLVGTRTGDRVGFDGVTALAGGSYVVNSLYWQNGTIVDAGAVTLCGGTASTSGVVTAANSVLGTVIFGGPSTVFDYQPTLSQLVVGRPASNIVSLFTAGGTTPTGPAIAVTTTVGGGSNIADGASLDLGGLLIGTRQSFTFTISNPGTADLTGVALTTTGTDKALFTVTAQPASLVAAGASTTFTIQFAPLTAGLKTAAVHVASNATVGSPYDITLTATSLPVTPPAVTTLAATSITTSSAVLNGSVDAKGTNRTVTFDYGLTTAYGSSVIATTGVVGGTGATPVYSPIVAGLLPHTKYNFRVRAAGYLGSAMGANLTFTTANHAPVAVNETVSALPSSKVTIHVLANDTDADMDALSIFSFTQPPASAGKVAKVGTDLVFTPSATYAGGVSFTYIAADAFGGHSNTATVTLTLSSLSVPLSMSAPAQGAVVVCPFTSTAPVSVTNKLPWVTFAPVLPTDRSVLFTFAPNPTATTRTGTVYISGKSIPVSQAGIAAAPVLTVPTVPDAAISAAYDLDMASHTQNAPVTYTATGLPPGLTLSNVTGHITGMPTTPVTGKTVTIVAKNIKGTSNTITFNMNVQAFPASLVGGYTVPIPRQTVVNGNLGGLLTFTVAANGPVTGTLINGAASYKITGRLNTAPYPALPDPLHARLTVTFPRAGLDPLVLVVNMNAPSDNRVNGTLTVGTTTSKVTLSGAQNVWSLPGHLAATAYAGKYTAALQPLSNSTTLPQGDGFLTLSVGTTGVVTWSGQLADGTVLVPGTTALGLNGEVPLFASLYSGTGSLQGVPAIVAATHVLGTAVTWSKAAQPASVRAYAAGFGTAAPGLSVVGSLYVPPVGSAVLPGVSLPSGGATIAFVDGGIGAVGMTASLTQSMTISTTNVATLPAITSGNLANIRVTSINASTGTFTGSMTLKDTNPFNAALPQVARVVAFNGVFLQGTQNLGTGYFLLPAIAGPPANVATSPETSGQVTITPH